MIQLSFFNNLMGTDGLVILVVGLLFFGRRLPEVGRNLWGASGKQWDSTPVEWLLFLAAVIAILALCAVMSQRSF